MEYGMEPISTDLRWRFLRDNYAGMTISDVAAKYYFSPAFVKKFRAQRARTGSIGPIQYKRGRKRALAHRSQEIRQLVDSGKAHTLEQIRSHLGCKESIVTI